MTSLNIICGSKPQNTNRRIENECVLSDDDSAHESYNVTRTEPSRNATSGAERKREFSAHLRASTQPNDQADVNEQVQRGWPEVPAETLCLQPETEPQHIDWEAVAFFAYTGHAARADGTTVDPAESQMPPLPASDAVLAANGDILDATMQTAHLSDLPALIHTMPEAPVVHFQTTDLSTLPEPELPTAQSAPAPTLSAPELPTAQSAPAPTLSAPELPAAQSAPAPTLSALELPAAQSAPTPSQTVPDSAPFAPADAAADEITEALLEDLTASMDSGKPPALRPSIPSPTASQTEPTQESILPSPTPAETSKAPDIRPTLVAALPDDTTSEQSDDQRGNSNQSRQGRDPQETLASTRGSELTNTFSTHDSTSQAEIISRTAAPSAAGTNLPAQTMDIGSFVEHFDRLALRTMRSDDQRVRIELEPAALGKLVLQCKETDRGLEIEIAVQGDAVRTLLMAREPELRASLESQGVQVGQFSVSCQDREGRPHQQQLAEVPNAFIPRNNVRTTETISESQIPARRLESWERNRWVA